MLDESTTLHGASSPESARLEQLRRRKPPESPERVSGEGQEATRQVARLVIERPQEATHLELLIPSDSVAPGTAVDRAHCSAVAEESVPELPRCARRFNGSPGPGRRRHRAEARLVDAGASTEGREGQRLATRALRGSEGPSGARRRSGGSAGAAEPEEAATRVAREWILPSLAGRRELENEQDAPPATKASADDLLPALASIDALRPFIDRSSKRRFPRPRFPQSVGRRCRPCWCAAPVWSSAARSPAIIQSEASMTPRRSRGQEREAR